MCDLVLGDEGKLSVPPELVSVYLEKVSNLISIDILFNFHTYHILSFSYIQLGYEFWNIWMLLTTTKAKNYVRPISLTVFGICQ